MNDKIWIPEYVKNVVSVIHHIHLCNLLSLSECTKKIVDLVFLFDGSGSMTKEEFDKNKGFINNIMTTLKNSSIKVFIHFKAHNLKHACEVAEHTSVYLHS